MNLQQPTNMHGRNPTTLTTLEDSAVALACLDDAPESRRTSRPSNQALAAASSIPHDILFGLDRDPAEKPPEANAPIIPNPSSAPLNRIVFSLPAPMESSTASGGNSSSFSFNDNDYMYVHSDPHFQRDYAEYNGRTNFVQRNGSYRKSHEIGPLVFAEKLCMQTCDGSDTDDNDDEEAAAMLSSQ